MNFFARLLAIGVIVVFSGQGRAEYPDKPLRLIVPFAPSGGVDIVARIVAQRLGENLKQPVVVDNRAGAGGVIGMQAVSRAQPDGYTFAITAQGVATLPSTIRDLPYDPIKGLEPVAHVTSVPIVLAVNKDVPAQNVREFIEHLRRNPGKLNAASSGPGTSLTVELFRLLTNTTVTIIAYSGTGPAATSVVRGDTQFVIFDTTTIKSQIKAGALRPLAVASEARMPEMPDVPTMKESGIDYVLDIWYGAFLPGGTPQNISRTLNAELRKAVQAPEVVQRLKSVDAVPGSNRTPEQFADFYRQQIDLWKDVVTRSGFKVD